MTRLIIVDDTPEDREFISDLAHSMGVDRADAFDSGEPALRHLREHGADCIALDYQLHGEDGLNLIPRFREIAPHCPILMLTGHGSEEIAAKAIRLGAADYMVKDHLTKTNIKVAIETAIKHAKLEARYAEQDAERRQFLRVLIHDLRAPLRRVRQLGEIASTESSAGNMDEMNSALAAQREVARRAGELIDALETYALLDGSIQFRQIMLHEAAEAAADNLADELSRRNATIRIDRLPKIAGHRPQLTQLFQNLFQNGIKYNQSGSPEISLGLKARSRNAVRIYVRDNGIGIPQQHAQAVFEPLKRLAPTSEYEGTGMGLAVCRKIVERHKGTIWCEPAEDAGTTFFIEFPI